MALYAKYLAWREADGSAAALAEAVGATIQRASSFGRRPKAPNHKQQLKHGGPVDMRAQPPPTPPGQDTGRVYSLSLIHI